MLTALVSIVCKFFRVEIDITGMQGICLLNIKSFGGGIDFWGKAPTDTRRFREPRMDDGMLEVRTRTQQWRSVPVHA
jgi:hypothetical protein